MTDRVTDKRILFLSKTVSNSYFQNYLKPGIAVHVFNPSTKEKEKGGFLGV